MKAERAVSLGILVIALLYLLFAIGIEERTIGHLKQVGPTARTVPMTLGLALLGLSSILIIKSFRGRRTEEPRESATGLVMITIVLSVVYVLLLRPAGFILASSALLYLLVYLSRAMYQRRIRFLPLIAGLFLNTALMVGLHWTDRTIVRNLAQYGRSVANALLSNRLFGTALMLILTAFLLVAINFLLRRFLRDRTDLWLVPMLASVGTTQILYLIFRQVFQVSLPPGLLTF